MVAYWGVQLVMVLEGVVMIESLFSWPGVGHGLAHAIFARDIPVIQGTAICLGILFVILNTCNDLLCRALDPRSTQAETQNKEPLRNDVVVSKIVTESVISIRAYCDLRPFSDEY